METRNVALIQLYEIFEIDKWTNPEKAARDTITELEPLFVQFLKPLLPNAKMFDPFIYCNEVIYALSATVTPDGCIPVSPKIHNLIFKFEINGQRYSYKYSFTGV